MIVAPEKMDEFEQLKAKVEQLSEEKTQMRQEINLLQNKSGLYDTVLTAVMPSLQLPLCDPANEAQLSLRAAAIKDITQTTLALPPPPDLIEKSVHVELMEVKDALIENERERREETKAFFTMRLEEIQSELEKAIQEKETAEETKKKMEIEKADADRRMEEVSKTVSTLSTRTDQLQRERDALKAKFDAVIKGHDQAMRNHGKHGPSQLKVQQGQKRVAVAAAMEAQTAAAAAYERDWAQKRLRH